MVVLVIQRIQSLISYIYFIVNKLPTDKVNKCNTPGMVWVPKQKVPAQIEHVYAVRSGTDVEAEKLESVCLLLPVSALLWWRKSCDEFPLGNITQQLSVFMAIQHIQTHEHSATQVPNAKHIWLVHSVPITAITNLITCSILWQINTFPRSYWNCIQC